MKILSQILPDYWKHFQVYSSFQYVWKYIELYIFTLEKNGVQASKLVNIQVTLSKNNLVWTNLIKHYIYSSIPKCVMALNNYLL